MKTSWFSHYCGKPTGRSKEQCGLVVKGVGSEVRALGSLLDPSTHWVCVILVKSHDLSVMHSLPWKMGIRLSIPWGYCKG